MPYPIPASYNAALLDSQITYTAMASVLTNGQPIITGLPVESLEVTASRSSAQRFSVTAVLTASQSIIPVDLTSAISPNGNEMQFFIEVAGTAVPIGIFPIVSVEIDDTGLDNVMTVTLSDRSWSISRRALTDAYNLSSTLTLSQAIPTLVNLGTATVPAFSESITPNNTVVGTVSYNAGQDPWQAASDMADGYGYELYFDYNGNLQSYPTPNPATQNVSWVYSETQGQGLPIISASRTLTADQITNNVIVQGTNSAGAAIQASAADSTNTASPTYINGPFGDIPSFVTTDVSTDLPSMSAYALSALTTSLGQSDTIQLEVMPNPALLIDDVCSVTRSRMGVSGALYVVDGYTLAREPGGTMTLDLRRVVA